MEGLAHTHNMNIVETTEYRLTKECQTLSKKISEHCTRRGTVFELQYEYLGKIISRAFVFDSHAGK